MTSAVFDDVFYFELPNQTLNDLHVAQVCAPGQMVLKTPLIQRALQRSLLGVWN